MKYTRIAYNLMDLLGDIAGIYELIIGFAGILFYRISEHSFIITVIKKMFLINTGGREDIMGVDNKTECYHNHDKIRALFM